MYISILNVFINSTYIITVLILVIMLLLLRLGHCCFGTGFGHCSLYVVFLFQIINSTYIQFLFLSLRYYFYGWRHCGFGIGFGHWSIYVVFLFHIINTYIYSSYSCYYGITLMAGALWLWDRFWHWSLYRKCSYSLIPKCTVLFVLWLGHCGFGTGFGHWSLINALHHTLTRQ